MTILGIDTSHPRGSVSIQIDDDELDFYDSLTRYVEDQSIKASQEDSEPHNVRHMVASMQVIISPVCLTAL